MKAPISWREKKTYKVFKKVTIVFHEHSFHRRLRVIPRRQVTRARGEDRREKKWLLLESRFRAAIFFSCLSSFSLSSTKRQKRNCLYSTFIVASVVTLVVIIITRGDGLASCWNICPIPNHESQHQGWGCRRGAHNVKFGRGLSLLFLSALTNFPHYFGFSHSWNNQYLICFKWKLESSSHLDNEPLLFRRRKFLNPPPSLQPCPS